MRRLLALIATGLLGLLWPFGAAVAAAQEPIVPQPPVVIADCAAPPPIEKAIVTYDIVLVGTVTETSNGGRWASVNVEEVWRGPDQPATVVVHGGPGGNAATSVDRSFQVGVRYLFTLYADPQLGLTDNSCTSTTPWAEAIAAIRPADWRTPTGPAPEPPNQFLQALGELIAPVGLVAIVAGVLLGVGLLARGRTEG